MQRSFAKVAVAVAASSAMTTSRRDHRNLLSWEERVPIIAASPDRLQGSPARCMEERWAIITVIPGREQTTSGMRGEARAVRICGK
jgi:hypothetical protein